MKKPEDIIKKRKEYLFDNNAYFYKNPPLFIKGKMQYLYDETGKEYLDMFAGVSVMNCGHSNDEIIGRVKNQLDNLQHTCTIYLTEPIVDLAEQMAKILPGDIKRSFFVNSGSEATEGALMAASLYTGKDKFIFLRGGLHGRTYLGMSVTGIDMWRGFIDKSCSFMADSFYPNVKKNDFDLKNASEKSLSSIKKILEKRGDEIAGLIVEPIQGNAGILVPYKDYFKKLKKLLAEYGVLLICDEVQTGFARTGKMFACEHFGVIPDIMIMAKALGNGTPIGAFSTTDEIAKKFDKPSASTLGGNPISMTAGLAVLDYIKNNDLVNRADKMGKGLKQKLEELKSKYDIIRDVRGLGLMIGVELVDDENKPMDKLTDEIIEQMKDKGIIIGKNGLSRNVLAFQPPLVINEEDIEKVISTLDSILRKL